MLPSVTVTHIDAINGHCERLPLYIVLQRWPCGFEVRLPSQSEPGSVIFVLCNLWFEQKQKQKARQRCRCTARRRRRDTVAFAPMALGIWCKPPVARSLTPFLGKVFK